MVGPIAGGRNPNIDASLKKSQREKKQRPLFKRRGTRVEELKTYVFLGGGYERGPAQESQLSKAGMLVKKLAGSEN